jgi:hypothetical protein
MRCWPRSWRPSSSLTRTFWHKDKANNGIEVADKFLDRYAETHGVEVDSDAVIERADELMGRCRSPSYSRSSNRSPNNLGAGPPQQTQEVVRLHEFARRGRSGCRRQAVPSSGLEGELSRSGVARLLTGAREWAAPASVQAPCSQLGQWFVTVMKRGQPLYVTLAPFSLDGARGWNHALQVLRVF